MAVPSSQVMHELTAADCHAWTSAEALAWSVSNVLNRTAQGGQHRREAERDGVIWTKFTDCFA